MKRRKKASTASRPSRVARSSRALSCPALLDHEFARRVVQAGAQAGQALVAHKREKLDLGLVRGRPRVEAGRPGLDREHPVAGQIIAPSQVDARQSLGREALEG